MDSDLSRLAGRFRQIPDSLLVCARELRKSQTSAEQVLWLFLRGRRLCGAKFRRQHNIDRFIADFYCHEAQLVIELDGSIHQTQKDKDSERDAWMIANGLTVLRFENKAIRNNLDSVLETICSHLPQHQSD
ncbi:MAG: DUF559 domain-containing protein [Cyanobacteria bacterium J06627_28]